MYMFYLSQNPGYSGEMKEESLNLYEYPKGKKWQELFAAGFLKQV